MQLQRPGRQIELLLQVERLEVKRQAAQGIAAGQQITGGQQFQLQCSAEQLHVRTAALHNKLGFISRIDGVERGVIEAVAGADGGGCAARRHGNPHGGLAVEGGVLFNKNVAAAGITNNAKGWPIAKRGPAGRGRTDVGDGGRRRLANSRAVGINNILNFRVGEGALEYFYLINDPVEVQIAPKPGFVSAADAQKDV